MSRYTTLTTWQLLGLALVLAILSAIPGVVNSWYMVWIKLPVVHTNIAGECIKVENFENGHAFNCTDVDVLLRQYRKSTE